MNIRRFLEKRENIFNIMEQTQIKISKNFKALTLVRDEESKVVIVMGKYKVHERKFDTFEQAEDFIGRKPYDLLINIVLCLLQQKEDYEKEQKRLKTASKKTKADAEGNK